MLFVNVGSFQVVYDANYLSLLVEEKEKCLNKIDYLQKQQAANQTSKRPTTRVTSSKHFILIELFVSLRSSPMIL